MGDWLQEEAVSPHDTCPGLEARHIHTHMIGIFHFYTSDQLSENMNNGFVLWHEQFSCSVQDSSTEINPSLVQVPMNVLRSQVYGIVSLSLLFKQWYWIAIGEF